MLEAQGVATHVTFDGSNLALKAKRVDRVIPIAQIVSIDFQEPSFRRGPGFVHFRLIGDAEAVGHGPNALHFDKQVTEGFRAIADAVRQAIADRATSGGAPAAAGSDDVFDTLRKLGELRDAGIVTADEFEAKKAELLSRI